MIDVNTRVRSYHTIFKYSPKILKASNKLLKYNFNNLFDVTTGCLKGVKQAKDINMIIIKI